MAQFFSNPQNIIGLIVLIVIVVLGILYRSGKSQTSYPYIRGSELYYRSLAHQNDTVAQRVSMGLPPSHTGVVWRDPPG